jgi:hypothetical protein
MRRTLLRLFKAQLSCGFRSWHNHTVELTRVKERECHDQSSHARASRLLQAGTARWLKRQIARVWAKWSVFAAKGRRARALMRSTASRMQRGKLGMAFNQWQRGLVTAVTEARVHKAKQRVATVEKMLAEQAEEWEERVKRAEGAAALLRGSLQKAKAMRIMREETTTARVRDLEAQLAKVQAEAAAKDKAVADARAENAQLQR